MNTANGDRAGFPENPGLVKLSELIDRVALESIRGERSEKAFANAALPPLQAAFRLARNGLDPAIVHPGDAACTPPIETAGDCFNTPIPPKLPKSLSDYTASEADLNILQALSEASLPMRQVEIVERSGEGQRKVKDRLGELEAVGLVERPHGDRSGYVITPVGRDLLEA